MCARTAAQVCRSPGALRVAVHYEFNRIYYCVIARSVATKQTRIYCEIATLPAVARNDRVTLFTSLL